MAKPVTVLLAVTSLWLSAAQATPILYRADFSGANEVPANGSPGTGTAEVEYDPTAHSLFVDVTFSGLTGTTTVAHIHCCAPPGSSAAPATPVPTFPGFPAGVVAGAYTQTFDLTMALSFNPSFVASNGGTPAGAEAALAAGLAGGQAYFNIHTTAFGGGEIRANLAAVPEPAAWSLVGFGVAALAVTRRKRRPAAARREPGAGIP